jgi:hypothetical protein
MKVDAKIFKGIEYVVISDLPQIQQQRLLDTINHDLFIKIMIEGKIITRCLQYKDYLKWYEQLRVATPVLMPEVKASERIAVKNKLAIDNI